MEESLLMIHNLPNACSDAADIMQNRESIADKEVHATANLLFSTSAESRVLKIRKQTAPAIAALASTDAGCVCVRV